MNDKESRSCIHTIEMLRRLAFNVHGLMDIVDARNCDLIIGMLSEEQERNRSMDFNMDDRQIVAKEIVVDYFNSRVDTTDKNGKITVDDVFVVWFSKTLQHFKVLLSTTVPDGMYYEVTYNGDKQEAYLDAYKKWENKCISLNGLELE